MLPNRGMWSRPGHCWTNPARQVQRGAHPGQLARDQHHIRRPDGDIGAGADGDPDIGRRQRRRVIDAVADEVV